MTVALDAARHHQWNFTVAKNALRENGYFSRLVRACQIIQRLESSFGNEF